eukprot:6212731-Pleurochrysis_carterae.AAC.1
MNSSGQQRHFGRLSRDHLELVCCFLPVLSIGVFAQCSKATREAAESETVWKAHFTALADEHIELKPHFDEIAAKIATGASARICFQEAQSELRSWQYAYAFQSWKAADYSSLKELGL